MLNDKICDNLEIGLKSDNFFENIEINNWVGCILILIDLFKLVFFFEIFKKMYIYI